jgi:two-component system cell cycle sensor histidine kinase/response regulator CckA
MTKITDDAALYQEIVESAPTAIIVVDSEGAICLSNQSAVECFGYTHEEFLQLNVDALILSGTREHHPSMRAEYQKAPESRRMGTGRELAALRKDGTEFPVEVSLNPIMSGGSALVIALVVDISERKALEQRFRDLADKLQHTQKLESLGVLAGGIAHDFNNVLTGVLGNAELAKLESAPEAHVRVYLDLIEHAAVRASDLCQQMLAYSGKGHFVTSTLNLNHIIEDTRHLLEVSISKTVVVRYDLFPGLAAVDGDATQFRQIIMNLIINASEAIGEMSGAVGVSTGVMRCGEDYLADTMFSDPLPEGQYVFLTVSDSGCGMTEEVKAKLFDPFFTTKFTGRGLGLAAVLGIVRGHGGAIRVYSEEGSGTTIRVMFPVSSKVPELQTTGLLDFDEPIGSGKVLVVDDEESVRAVVCATLESVGFEVMTADDGRQGLEVFEANRDDLSLVLMDLTMPHMNGVDAFRAIRKLSPEVPVILTSGYSEDELSSRYAGRGFAGFLQKPFRPTDLLKMIKTTLAGSEFRR